MSLLIGALIGAFVLAASIPVVAPLVLTFKSPEFFALALLVSRLSPPLAAKANQRNGCGGSRAGTFHGRPGSPVGNASLRPRNDETLGWSCTCTCDGRALCDSGIVDLWVRGTSIADKRIGKLGGGPRVRDTFTHWGVTVRCSLIGTRRYYSRFGRGCFPVDGPTVMQCKVLRTRVGLVTVTSAASWGRERQTIPDWVVHWCRQSHSEFPVRLSWRCSWVPS